MATVVGKTSIKIDDLINDTVVGGYVDSVRGQLILVTRGGAEIFGGSIGQQAMEQHNLAAMRTYHLHAAKRADISTPGTLDVVLGGDSLSEGWSGTGSSDEGTAQGIFRTQLARVFNPKARYGYWVPGGSNWYSSPKFSANGASSEVNQGISIRGRQIPPGAAAATATVVCDRIKVHYRLRNAFGSGYILIKIDGATVLDTPTFKNTGTYCSNANGNEVAVFDSGALARGSHTLSIEQHTVGGFNDNIQVDGAFFHDGDASDGFRFWNASHFGHSFADYISSNNPTLNQGYLSAVRQGLINPRLWIHAHGINEGVDFVTLEAHIRQMVQDIWDAQIIGGSDPCSQVLAIPPKTGTKTQADWDLMRAVYYRVGFELGLAVWDWNSYMGDLNDADDVYGLSSDGIHPEVTGQRMYGYFLATRALSNLPITLGLGRLQDQVTALSGGAAPNITRYTTPQTDTPYAVPAGALALTIRMGGGAAGAGSGRRGAAGTVRCGGGGSGSGGYSEIRIPTSDLPSTLYVNVGAGGPGGAAVTVNDTNGNPGTAGGKSDVKTAAATGDFTSNLVLQALGGQPGAGGTNGAGAGGLGGVGQFTGATGGSANATGLVGTAGGVPTKGAGGGGSGGGITTANAVSNGGPGQTIPGFTALFQSAGASPGGNGNNGLTPAIGVHPGQAGSGGASSITGTGGNGGNGGRMAGAGGGGASLNANNSGAGGTGGDGFVEIIAEF